MQSRSDRDIWGADVSHYQGSISWPKVAAAGLQFVIIKASEGIGIVDQMLRRNALGAAAVGIPAGFYHYAHPELNKNPIDEARAFLAAIDDLPHALPLFLDVEGHAGKVKRDELTRWCDIFLQEVQYRTGSRVGLYTGAYFAKDNLGPELGKYPLWIAHYGGTMTPLGNDTWEKWSIFQVSDNGSCPGIGEGNVDMNMMTAEFWAEIMAPPVVAEPDPGPPQLQPMTPEDANKVIAFLGAAHDSTSDPEARAEFHRLANELRRISGQPIG